MPSTTSRFDNFGFPPQNGLRTAVIAKRLTAGHIYDAVKNLRVYYTGAPGIKVLFSVNGMIQGSVLPRFEKYIMNLKGMLDEGHSFRRVDVYGESERILLQKDLTGDKVDLDLELPPGSRYYFLKVVRDDGHYAVTALVWTE